MRDWLPAVRPACRSLLHPLVDRLLAQGSQLGEQPAALLHGDLHLQNFFVEGETVALIDLDNAYVGAPWQDVSSFLASLFYRALLLGTPAAVVEERVRAFTVAYQQHVPWQVPQWALNWFVAAALINERAFRCVSRYKDGRPAMIDALLRLADQLTKTGFAYE
jgi:Ser/Thr protein kinase RdoA (MazF antagonist)